MSPARLAAAAAVLLSASAARAGVVIEGTDDGETQRFLMEGQKLRIETGESREAMIFDGATNASLQLDPEKKTYTEFTPEDFAKMQSMMKERGGPKKVHTVKYEKTGKTDEALGKKCDVYRVVDSDAEPEDEQTVCLAPFGTFGVGRDDFAAFRAFGAYASQLTGGEVERSWADLPGIPLISWEKEDGEMRETFRATKVEKRRIAASDFTAPAGWKKGPGFAEQMRQLEEMGGAQGAPKGGGAEK